MSMIASLGHTGRKLRRHTGGVALIEFAFSLPLVLTAGLYGLETANLALTNLKISQIALNLADNASRVGLLNDIQIEQLREVDINDVLSAASQQGAGIGLDDHGRIILSSLENSDGTQMIHWQRCMGKMTDAAYASHYGITATNGKSTGSTYDKNAGVNTASSGDNSSSHPGSQAIGGTGQSGITGMGDSAAEAVVAPDKGAVMFVEINYQYQPLLGDNAFSRLLLGGQPRRVHYIASFVIRDNRDLSQIYNPSPTADRATCDRHDI